MPTFCSIPRVDVLGTLDVMCGHVGKMSLFFLKHSSGSGKYIEIERKYIDSHLTLVIYIPKKTLVIHKFSVVSKSSSFLL